jgi:hypothetical protein
MDTPRVVSFSGTSSQGKPVRFTVGTDIIDYVEAARSFGRDDLAAVGARGRYQRRMIALPDRQGEVVTPMVLTISNENGLYLVRRQAQGANVGGWQLIDLGEAFKTVVGSTPQVRALGANWTDDGRIALAVAVDDGTASAPSHVLVAYDLSSKDTDWERIPWVDCGVRERVRVESIRVLDEGDGTWTVVLAGDRGPDDTFYLLRNDLAPSFAGALIFSAPVTMQEIFDFETARHPVFGSGLVVLGTAGGTRVLAFRNFPTFTQGRISSVPPPVPLPCPPGANVLDAGVIRNGGTDLYIGGQGLHLITAAEFANAEDAQLTPVLDAEAAPNVQDVIAAEAPDGSTAVWALLQNGDLEVVKRAASATQWGTPLRLRGGVQEIAPVHGDRHATTSLLVVYTDGQAATVWQDTRLGIWQESPLVVANPRQVAKVTCYGTSLRLLDASGTPQPGVTVKVSASVLTSVLLNNKAVFIGPGITAETQTNASGGVSLFDAVRSLTPAIYRFAVDGIGESIDVNPAGGIHERFKAVTADELRNATIETANGAVPLLPDNFRTGTDRNQIDVVAGSLNHVSSLASMNGVAPGVRQVDGAGPFSSALQAAAAPAGYRWGIHVDNTGVRAADNSIVDKLVGAAESVGDFFVNLGESIADFFEGVAHRIKEGWTFVLHKAEQAFEFICALGDKIKRFVLDTVEQIGSFFTWLWDQIKIGLERLWDWLKFVFSWRDILRVRNAMVDAIDEGLHDMLASITPMKTSVSAGFDHMLNEIRRWRSDAGDMKQLQPVSAGSGLLDVVKTITEPVQWLIDKVMGNSFVAWVENKLDSLFDYVIDIQLPDRDANLLAAAQQFFRDLVANQLNDLMNSFTRLASDLARTFEGKMPGVNDLSFATIKNALVIVGEDVLEGVLTMMRDLVLSGLDLVQAMIDTMRNTMFAKVRFPFVEELVKLVTAGFVSVDTSFRLIDGLMLIFAIPATIMYKLIAGEAPLNEGAVIALPYGRSITVQSGSDNWRVFTQVLGVIAAWIKLGKVASDLREPKQEAISGMLADPNSPLKRWGAAVFGTVGVVAERLGRHTNKGTPVTELEDTMFAISVFLNAKTYAYLLVADAADFLEQIVAMAGQPGFNPLMRANAYLDAGGYFIHFILRTVVYGIIVDAARQPGRAETDEISLETLAWVDAYGDQTGSAAVSCGSLEVDPPMKAMWLFGALSCKITAAVMHSTRAGIAIRDGVALYS